MRTVQQIDRDIDATRRALMARMHCDPGLSVSAWQNAWDRCPDLHAREHELFCERGFAQQERDRLAEIEYRHEQRKAASKRAAATRKAQQFRQCPTCGSHTLAS